MSGTCDAELLGCFADILGALHARVTEHRGGLSAAEAAALASEIAAARQIVEAFGTANWRNPQ